MSSIEQIKLPAETHIASAALQVSNLERAISFYRDRLGFQVIERQERVASLSASGQPPHQIRLVERPGAAPKPPRTTGLFHLAIRLPGRSALANLLLHMIQEHVNLQGASDHRVSEALYLSDPDGNGLELYVDRPRDRWPRSGDQIEMTTETLDIDDLLDQADQTGAGWGGIHPGTEIGHIHLQVADLIQTEAFYHNLLGFDVTQRSYPGALFFAAGDYHHHIGANIWSSRGAPPPPPEVVGLISFAVRIPGQGKEEEFIRHLESARTLYDVLAGPNGGASLMVSDPFANLVELIFDSANID
ncbi:MAG TPA: VOC family protein [Anaerolineales bacterium]|nr:VOC family protein [Anaerolineales bacterium]